MNETTKVYKRIQNLYESLWGGVKNIPEVLDFKFTNRTLNYIVSGVANILYTLDDSVNSNNILVRLTCYQEKVPYYTFCLYQTNESDLSKVHPVPINEMGAYYDRILSMRVFNDYTKIVYSDGLSAIDINAYLTQIENMIYDYLDKHNCNEDKEVNLYFEAKELEDLS